MLYNLLLIFALPSSGNTYTDEYFELEFTTNWGIHKAFSKYLFLFFKRYESSMVIDIKKYLYYGFPSFS